MDAFSRLVQGQREVAGIVEATCDSGGGIVLHTVVMAAIDIVNNKDQMLSDVYTMFRNKGLGWLSVSHAHTFGHTLVKALAEVLWEITDQRAVLAQRCCDLEPVWDKFVGCRRLTHKPKRTMELDTLALKCGVLERVIAQTWWTACDTWSSGWRAMKQDVDNMCTKLNRFLDQRVHNRNIIIARRQVATPVLVRGSAYDMYPVIRARVPTDNELPPELTTLALVVGQTDFYEAISLSETGHMPSSDASQGSRHLKAKFVHMLKTTPLCSTPSVLFYYFQGGAAPTLYWLWRCDPAANKEADKAANEVTVAKLVGDIPRQASRQELRDMTKELDRIGSTRDSKRRMKNCFRLLCGGMPSKLAMSAQTECNMEHILNYGSEIEVIRDMRRGFGGAPLNSTSFDAFWDLVRIKVGEYAVAPHPRRSDGSTFVVPVVADKAPPASIADLYAVCCEAAAACSEVVNVPGFTWFRMQFAPKTAAAALAVQRTGRFQVKWMIQGHHLRAHHEDSHYGAKCYQYLREMAVLLRDVAVFVCQDDKKKIAVGEPGLPLAGATSPLTLTLTLTLIVLYCS